MHAESRRKTPLLLVYAVPAGRVPPGQLPRGRYIESRGCRMSAGIVIRPIPQRLLIMVRRQFQSRVCVLRYWVEVASAPAPAERQVRKALYVYWLLCLRFDRRSGATCISAD